MMLDPYRVPGEALAVRMLLPRFIAEHCPYTPWRVRV
jgi:hypothetical protein